MYKLSEEEKQQRRKEKLQKPMRLTVFETRGASNERLRNLVEGLAQPYAEYNGGGVDVTERDNVSGIYEITPHNGFQDLPSSTVRIVGDQIWCKDASPLIESSLRENKIGYQRGHFSTTGVYAGHSQNVAPAKIKDTIDVTYTPKKTSKRKKK